MKPTHRRDRYQRGSLTIEGRASGPDVWAYRWRESDTSGKTVQRKRLIGTRSELPTESAAWKAIEGLQLDINVEAISTSPLTVEQLTTHYKDVELSDDSNKTKRTRDVYRQHLDAVIRPKWGKVRLSEVKPVAVEKWLKGLVFAPATKAKTKNVFGALFQHAMRYEWASSNPIRLVRQSAKRQADVVVLEPVEVAALLTELREPFRTLILIAAVTGLRRGELFGLKWEDVNFRDAEIRIVRSVVDQVEGPPKTLTSLKPIPMSSELSDALNTWRTQTSFPKDSDWIFASPMAAGKLPYWPDAVLKRHILPAAERARVTKRIGWHTFRRTTATLLQSSGASVKTTQELLRHASPVMTLGTYAQAVTADKRLAQSNLAALFVGNREAAA